MAQKGTIKVQTENGTASLPVHETSDFSEEPIIKVQTETGIGGLNLVDPGSSDASPVKINTMSQGIQAIATVGPTQTGLSATVDASLNSQDATVYVYEDTTGDGTADNTTMISVLDGSNTYDLTTFSGGTGNDYWVEVKLENSNVEKTTEINSVTISV